MKSIWTYWAQLHDVSNGALGRHYSGARVHREDRYGFGMLRIELPATWVLGFFGSFYVLCTYMYLSDWYRWQDQVKERPQPTIASLKQLLAEVPFADQTTITSSLDRDANVSVNGRFKSEMVQQRMVDLFKSQLAEEGWWLTQETIRGKTVLKFCKGGVAASIQPEATADGSVVDVRLAWTYHSRSTDYCPIDILPDDKGARPRLAIALVQCDTEYS